MVAADTFERPIYADNAIATVQSVDATMVITTSFDAAASGSAAAVQMVASVPAGTRSAYVGSEIAKNDRPELTAAKIIFSRGGAIGSCDKFNEVLTPLADKLGAALSGAIQHQAGMKDSKVIVAINKDAEAPIFSVADYGLEADLFAAVPELTPSI